MARKYFKSKAEAKQALCDRKRNNVSCCDEIFKMPKGTRHAGQYAVCSHMEYLKHLLTYGKQSRNLLCDLLPLWKTQARMTP